MCLLYDYTTDHNENENYNENEIMRLIVMKIKTIMENRSHDEKQTCPDKDINTLNVKSNT